MPSSGRSIGEVIATLKSEFPDVTISKIRFLESQGLVAPERKPSGYRMFSDADMARLKYILREQKQHFLPLKVIKERLESSPLPSATVASNGAESTTPGDDGPVPGQMLDEGQLAGVSGLTVSQLQELEKSGFLRSERTGQRAWYDDRAVTMANLAARFFALGVEVRHLRFYKTAAEREADLYKQLSVAPRDQRNTTARMEYEARIEELGSLGAQMRAELLRSAMEG